jgi:hypothetical protein
MEYYFLLTLKDKYMLGCLKCAIYFLLEIAILTKPIIAIPIAPVVE